MQEHGHDLLFVLSSGFMWLHLKTFECRLTDFTICLFFSCNTTQKIMQMLLWNTKVHLTMNIQNTRLKVCVHMYIHIKENVEFMVVFVLFCSFCID